MDIGEREGGRKEGGRFCERLIRWISIIQCMIADYKLFKCCLVLEKSWIFVPVGSKRMSMKRFFWRRWNSR
jgi:hypothetical protein